MSRERFFAPSDGRRDALTWVRQCMDVTLNENFTIPSDISCANLQGQPPSNQSGSPTSSGTPSSTGSSSGDGPVLAAVNGLLGLSLAGILAVMLV